MIRSIRIVCWRGLKYELILQKILNLSQSAHFTRSTILRSGVRKEKRFIITLRYKSLSISNRRLCLVLVFVN